MAPLLAKASSLDIDGWIRGLLSAGISGFFSALTGAVVLPSLDAKDFNILTPKYYIALFALGTAAAIVSISKFLSATPLPGLKAVTATKEVTSFDGGPTKIVETVSETHVEPIKSSGQPG